MHVIEPITKDKKSTGAVTTIARRTNNHNYGQDRDERHTLHRLDANVEEEGEAREAREGRNLGEDEELIGRGGDDTVDVVGGH